jgi:hypothetical protein
MTLIQILSNSSGVLPFDAITCDTKIVSKKSTENASGYHDVSFSFGFSKNYFIYISLVTVAYYTPQPYHLFDLIILGCMR